MVNLINQLNCIFCKTGIAKFWFSKISSFDNNLYPIYICKNCKGGFVFPIPSPEYLSNFYTNYVNLINSKLSHSDFIGLYRQVLTDERSYPNSSIDAARIAFNLNSMCSGKKILDIGGGYGFFSRELLNLGFEVDSIELNDVARKIYEQMNGFFPNNLFFNTAFAVNNFEKYDGVLISQVLEHLPMDQDPIKNINIVLKPGGICVVAVPHFKSFISLLQGKNDMFIVPPEHINFFTIKSLDKAFISCGFKNIYTETISRYNYNLLEIKCGLFYRLVAALLKYFLLFSDRNKKGMFINSYFKKKLN